MAYFLLLLLLITAFWNSVPVDPVVITDTPYIYLFGCVNDLCEHHVSYFIFSFSSGNLFWTIIISMHYPVTCLATVYFTWIGWGSGGKATLSSVQPENVDSGFGVNNVLKMIGKGFYRKWVKSSFEQFITTQTCVGSTNGWIISQNAEILSFIFRQSPEIFGICDVI